MPKILITDDDAHIVRVMSIWLRRQGYDTVTAHNGRDALELIEREKIDLVISDMNMPVLDGLGLTREIRKRGLDSLPIILLTARCDQGALTEQLRAYHAQVAPKPFVPSQLVEQINGLLGVANRPT